jgi:hypothetical protein
LTQLALRSGAVAPATLDATGVTLVRAQIQRIAERIDVYVDGQRAFPTIEYVAEVNPALTPGLEPAARGHAGMLHLSGTLPPGAERLSFAYHWTYGAMAVVVEDDTASIPPRVLWLGPGERSPELSTRDAIPPPIRSVVREYVQLGFTHILPKGLDHILFVLGLFFLRAGWRALLVQVSTFTIAHTMTLGLTTLGMISISPSIVEPLIALSIAYVAIENLTTTELRTERLLLVFCFGLLHGMGFAGVLTELGLPAAGFVVALLSFNVGVELGQIALLAVATIIVAGWRRREVSSFSLIARPASMLIAAGGLYWTVQRLMQ